MIPLKLHIKNFVSYGPQTQIIDFSPYQLICLSGKNGHGKSALLDALTWAIWGQARKIMGVNKADEGLLRLGQTHMMVTVDFSCGQSLYRIRREYTHSSHKAHSELIFGIIDVETGLFKPLTDKTIKSTQDKINLMLGLDFESFINSAFLRQGQSNEFSKKTPKDRKEVLASILGLDHYERIRKRASDRSKEVSNEKEQAEKIYQTLQEDIKQKELVTTQLIVHNQKLKHLADQELVCKSEYQELKKEQNTLAVVKQHYERDLYKFQQIKKTIAEGIPVFKQHIEHYRSVAYKQRNFCVSSDFDSELTQLQHRLTEIQETTQKQFQLKEQYLLLKQEESKYLQEKTELNQQEQERYKLADQQAQLTINALGLKLNDLRLQQLKLTQEQAVINHELGELKSATTHSSYQLLDTDEKQFEKRKAFYHKYIAHAQRLKNELNTLDQKRILAHHDEQPQCPLCQQNLSSEHKQTLIIKFTSQERFFGHQLTRLATVIKQLKSLLVDQHAFIEESKRQQQQKKIDSIKLEELIKQAEKKETDISELVAAQNTIVTELEKTRKELFALKSDHAAFVNAQAIKLTNDKKYQTVCDALIRCQKEMDGYILCHQQEKEINERIRELMGKAQEHMFLLKEIELQKERKSTIRQACIVLKQLKREQEQLEQELAKTKLALQKEQVYALQEHNLLESMHKLIEEKETLIHHKGALEQQQKSIEQKEQESLLQKKRISSLEAMHEEYLAIAGALSKDGIQALLIEDALPEIELEANKLLAKLTDNQAHLSIESLRDLKSGGAKETLDIKISDSIGIRPYELFSGGEAFRIDFALRIAISKLLARRAGTALQTLIIDEGFGSQDDDGLAHIVDALHKIQDDFAKIIVVSHLPSLKEQFPIHFLVHKGPAGSSIKVIENQ